MPDQQSYTDGAGRENVFIILTLWRRLTVAIDHEVPWHCGTEEENQGGAREVPTSSFFNLNPHM